MTPNVFSVDLFVSKGADGALLVDIHPDNKCWYTHDVSKSELPVLTLSEERFPRLCIWLEKQLEKSGGSMQIARFYVMDNPSQLLTLIIQPDAEVVPQEELERLQSDEELCRYAHDGWNWNTMADIGSLARLADLPSIYIKDIEQFRDQLLFVLACLKNKLGS